MRPGDAPPVGTTPLTAPIRLVKIVKTRDFFVDDGNVASAGDLEAGAPSGDDRFDYSGKYSARSLPSTRVWWSIRHWPSSLTNS